MVTYIYNSVLALTNMQKHTNKNYILGSMHVDQLIGQRVKESVGDLHGENE